MFVCTVVGARPNFMKMAPVVHELRSRNIELMLVHTGQHYDDNMSRVFFTDLKLSEPDVYLNIAPDTQVRQTASIMNEFESVCSDNKFDLILVGGGVTSTFAAAYVGAKLQIPVGHVEAGLRSFDMSTPEEINRMLTDHISSLLFTTEEAGNTNLANEGIAANQVHFVGNCMVDTLLISVDRAKQEKPWRSFNLKEGQYPVMTLHHPSNVDSYDIFTRLLKTIGKAVGDTPIIFPVHPRTRRNMAQWQMEVPEQIIITEPLPYLKYIGLMDAAKFVMTDSGGIQEETTALGIPCLTLRDVSDRPVTAEMGSNRIVGREPRKIKDAVKEILADKWNRGTVPPLWDGNAATRIVDVVQSWAKNNQVQ
ncbi:non-hydrolyzing UDP-N-acetylglucosamine 2-epimerase [Calditrichota bacterium]